MQAIRSFTGDDVELAVVEPEARAVLESFDTRVRHIELADADAFGPLELIDLPAVAAAHEPWFNETLTTVNDAVVRLGVIEGDFHWHKHDDQDEFFLVLSGKLLIDVEDRETVRARPPPRLHGAAGRGAPYSCARANGDRHGRGSGRQPHGRLSSGVPDPS